MKCESYFTYKGTKSSTQFQEKDRTRFEHGPNVLIKIQKPLEPLNQKSSKHKSSV